MRNLLHDILNKRPRDRISCRCFHKCQAMVARDRPLCIRGVNKLLVGNKSGRLVRKSWNTASPRYTLSIYLYTLYTNFVVIFRNSGINYSSLSSSKLSLSKSKTGTTYVINLRHKPDVQFFTLEWDPLRHHQQPQSGRR